jgi:hypothetical protein
MSSSIPYSRLSFCLRPYYCLSGTIMRQHLSSEQPQDAFTLQRSPGGFKPGRSYLRKDVRTSFKLCTDIFQKMYAHLLKHMRTSFQRCTEIFFQIYGHLSQGIRYRSADMPAYKNAGQVTGSFSQSDPVTCGKKYSSSGKPAIFATTLPAGRYTAEILMMAITTPKLSERRRCPGEMQSVC